jgi:hypothetical protein
MDAVCSKCGVALAPGDVLYTASAEIVCAKCFGVADIAATDQRAANNIVAAAGTCLLAAVIGWFINPVFLATFMSLASGGFALKSMLPGNERFTKLLGPGKRTLVWVVAGTGIAITLFQLFVVLNVISIGVSHR